MFKAVWRILCPCAQCTVEDDNVEEVTLPETVVEEIVVPLPEILVQHIVVPEVPAVEHGDMTPPVELRILEWRYSRDQFVAELLSGLHPEEKMAAAKEMFEAVWVEEIVAPQITLAEILVHRIVVPEIVVTTIELRYMTPPVELTILEWRYSRDQFVAELMSGLHPQEKMAAAKEVAQDAAAMSATRPPCPLNSQALPLTAHHGRRRRMRRTCRRSACRRAASTRQCYKYQRSSRHQSRH